MSSGHEPQRPRSLAITAMQALPCSHACRRGGEGACVYKGYSCAISQPPKSKYQQSPDKLAVPLPKARSS